MPTFEDDIIKVLITHQTITGIRSEWPYVFVDLISFKTHFELPADDKALKLKVITLTNAQLGTETGVLMKPDQIPHTLRHVKVVLYHDEQTSLHEFI